MMKVRMVTLMAGPGGVCAPGQVVDVDDRTGQDLLAGGYAVAMVAPRERAVLPDARVAGATTSAAVLPVTAILGIGPARVKALAALGIRTVPELLAADPGFLDQELDGVTAREIGRWLAQARQWVESRG